MAIELRGPEGYDHQYRITILVTLAVAAKYTLNKALIEPEGAEDALLEYQRRSDTIQLEVQAKKQSGDASIAKLGSVLAHFPSGASTNCLADRVIGDPKRQALWVTGSRASDDTRALLETARVFEPHTNEPLAHDKLDELRTALRTAWAGKTPLKRARRAHCSGVTSNSPGLAAALRRIFIWELHDDMLVRSTIKGMLTQRPFSVPLAEVDAALAEMTDVIRNIRNTRSDAWPGLRVVLSEFSQHPMRQAEFWYPRSDEGSLYSELMREYVLALTGHSKSGKTALACEFLDRLQTAGWRCEITRDPATAERFLHSNDLQQRACLLDDPFEGVRPEDIAWRVDKVRSLREFCKAGRMLLVTSRADTLQQRLKWRRQKATVAGFTWHDVTVRDNVFAIGLWEDLAKRRNLPAAVVRRVSTELRRMSPAGLLQPGQINQLSRRTDTVGKTITQLLEMARYNAEDLAIELRHRSPAARRTIAALGVCGTAIEGVDIVELSFVLSDSAARPSWQEGGTRILGGTLRRGKFPDYDTAFALSADASGSLAEFAELGYIVREGDRFRFTHPDYAESFSQVCTEELVAGNDLLERGLSCLDPIAAKAAVRALERRWDQASDPDKPTLADLALKVFGESILPAVQETALGALLSRISTVNRSKLGDIWSALSWHRNPDYSLTWEGETPWFDRNPRSMVGTLGDRSHRRLRMRDIQSALKRLAKPSVRIPVTARQADAVVTYLEENASVIPAPLVLPNIARLEDSFLRSDAIAMLCDGRVTFSPDIAALMDDSDPRVTARAIQTCVEAWAKHDSQGTLPAVRTAVKECLERTPVTVLSAGFFFDFGDPYSEFGRIPWEDFTSTQKNTLWNFWCECMAIIFRVLGSHRIRFKDGDLWNSLGQVGQFAARENLMLVFDAWAEWIDAQGKVGGLSDYSMGIAGVALECSTLTSDDRVALLGRWLRFRTTNAMLECTKDTIDLWPELAEAEKDLVRRFVQDTGRRDRDWLVAAIVLRGCPSDLLTEAIGRPDLYDLVPAAVSTALGPNLTAAVLAFYCRETPAKGAHYPRRNSLFWDRFWWAVALDPTHANHALALWELIHRVAVHLSDDQEQRVRCIRAFVRLCNRSDATGRKQLFSELLTTSVDVTDPDLSECWTALFSVCSVAERKRFASALAKNAEVLSLSEDAMRFLGTSWREAVYPLLKTDYLILTALHAYRGVSAPKTELFAFVNTIYRASPPRSVWIHDLALELFDSSESTDVSAKQRIKDARDETFRVAGEQRDKLRSSRVRTEKWIW